MYTHEPEPVQPQHKSYTINLQSRGHIFLDVSGPCKDVPEGVFGDAQMSDDCPPHKVARV